MVDHPIVRHFAGEIFHGEAEATQIVKGIVVVQQSIEIAGPAKIGSLHRLEPGFKTLVQRFAVALIAIGMAEALHIGAGQCFALAPGARALDKAVDAGAIAAGGIAVNAENSLPADLDGIATSRQGCPHIRHPGLSNAVAGQGFVAIAAHARYRLQGGGKGWFKGRIIPGNSGGGAL